MKSIFAIAVTLVVAAVSRSFAVTPDVVVATNLQASRIYTSAWEEVGLISPSYNNYNNVSKGQSFTPAISGTLTTVDALIARDNSSAAAPPPLKVSIYTASAGIPINLLGTKQFSSSAFSPILTSTNYRETIDFSQLSIPLVAGTQYLIAFETPFGISGSTGSDAPYFVGFPFEPPPSTLGHSMSFARNGHDWEVFANRELFITVRATVPEPSSVLLLLTAGAALALLRLRVSL